MTSKSTMKTVTVFESFVRAIENGLGSDAERGQLYSAIMRYSLYGEEPEGLPPVSAAFFDLMRPNIDMSNRRREAGSRGGRNREELEPEMESEAVNEEEFTEPENEFAQTESKVEAKLKQNASKTQAKFKQTESKVEAKLKQCPPKEEEEEEEYKEKTTVVVSKKADNNNDNDNKRRFSSGKKFAEVKISDNVSVIRAGCRPYPENSAEVLQEAERIGYAMTQEEAEKFIAVYSATGWKIRGSTIEDWRRILTVWKNQPRSHPHGKRADNSPEVFEVEYKTDEELMNGL